MTKYKISHIIGICGGQCMAQVTIYLPQTIEKAVKRLAEKKQMSLSSLITEMIRKSLFKQKWPKGFVELYGSCRGDFPEVEKLAVEEEEGF
jgi:hypothetical protein